MHGWGARTASSATDSNALEGLGEAELIAPRGAAREQEMGTARVLQGQRETTRENREVTVLEATRKHVSDGSHHVPRNVRLFSF